MKKSNDTPKAPESRKPPTADEIAEIADKGENISRFFSRKGKMMLPITPAWKEEGNGQED
jgi:hypothetical protein